MDTLRSVAIDYQALVDEERGFPHRADFIALLEADPSVLLECMGMVRFWLP